MAKTLDHRIPYMPTPYYAVVPMRRINGQLIETSHVYLGSVRGKTFTNLDSAAAASAMCSARYRVENNDEDIVFAVVYFP
jgi:hypothetical protein